MLLGIVTEVSEHPLNAEFSIDVTEDGIVTEDKLQLSNAYGLIVVTELGITTEVICVL